MKTTITAVIFDMDGVLFDTERMYMECWREAAEPRGLKNVDEISKACIGRTLQGTKEVFEAAKAEQGIDVSFEELHEDCSRRFKEKEEREGLPEKPGVHEILEYLKAFQQHWHPLHAGPQLWSIWTERVSHLIFRKLSAATWWSMASLHPIFI